MADLKLQILYMLQWCEWGASRSDTTVSKDFVGLCPIAFLKLTIQQRKDPEDLPCQSTGYNFSASGLLCITPDDC